LLEIPGKALNCKTEEQNLKKRRDDVVSKGEKVSLSTLRPCLGSYKLLDTNTAFFHLKYIINISFF